MKGGVLLWLTIFLSCALICLAVPEQESQDLPDALKELESDVTDDQDLPDIIIIDDSDVADGAEAVLEKEEDVSARQAEQANELEASNLGVEGAVVVDDKDGTDDAAAALEKEEIGGTRKRSYRFHFRNSCRYPVRLLVRYKALNNRWYTVGWWTFAPDEAAYLRAGGSTLRTGDGVWYYYARSTKGGKTWSGPYKRRYNGKLHGMRRKYDSRGDNNWAVTCN